MVLSRLAPLMFAPLLLAAAPPEGTLPGRLPADVVPLHYDMTIDPDAAALRFTGRETITIDVTQPTTTIVLNAAELQIGAVTLDGVAAKAALDEAGQTLTVTLPKAATVGQHKLAIDWTGKINQSAAGLFAVDYNDAKGAQRMLVTQMEPADGRRFAPMWDEPARKATFRLTISTPKGLTSFSNMPIERTAPGTGGDTLVTFATSPKMSSYLLFMGMGDVERRARKVGNVEIGMITRKGALDQGDYALDAAAKLLPYFNDYFGIDYPLPKMDMIAAPGSSQFFSAMENWGAILYFDRAVLLDPKLSTESNRQGIFNVVAHEMAHQWFGDIVTMSWWDDLWLNEGFASWMASKASADLNPDWNVPGQVAAGARQAAFAVDARSSTHPVIQQIATVDEVSQAFDTITYQKGQATIRMIEAAVGPDAFRDGVRRYMAKYKYGNTVTDNLWTELAAASGRPVKTIADSFTLQPGVPLIRSGEPTCAGGTTRIALSQDRFGLDAASKAALRWNVPVALNVAGAGDKPAATATVSGPAQQAATMPGCGLTVINPGQYGYFRTLHAPKHFEALTAGFARLALPDQVGLMGDSVALANGGYEKIDRYLGLVERIPADAHPLVWEMAAGQLAGLDGRLSGGAQAAFRAKAGKLLSPQLARVGWASRPGEDPSATTLREELISALGAMADPAVVARARQYAAGDLDAIPAAIREPVLYVAALNADAATWERLHGLARVEKSPSAQRSLYTALGRAADPALAQRALALALTDEATVPNRASIIGAVGQQHPATAFDWAVANEAKVNALIEASAKPRFIVGLAGAGDDPALAGRVQTYAERALPASSRQGANTAISSITYRARLKSEQAGAIGAWAAR